MQKYVLFLALLLCLSSFAEVPDTVCYRIDTEDVEVVDETQTKYRKCILAKGKIIKILDLTKDNLEIGDNRLDAILRVVIIDDKKHFFLVLRDNRLGISEHQRCAYIDYYDLIELLKACNQLFEECKIDMSSKALYFNNYYISEDSFVVGYDVKGKKTRCYLCIQENSVPIEIPFFKQFTSILENTINAIEGMSQKVEFNK